MSINPVDIRLHQASRVLEIQFEDGVWIYKRRWVGLTYETVKRVYDKYGILIYSASRQVNQARNLDETMYYERVQ